MPADDCELVRKLQRGDAAAGDQLVRDYGGGLFATALALLGNAQDAEDVVQETFMGALRRLDTFEHRASLKTWLSRILLYQVLKYRRSRKLRRMAPLDPTEEGDEHPSAAGGLAAHTATQVEHRADIGVMLNALSEDHRQVIVLREVRGFSYQEIADTLGIPRGTVESRLSRARQELKDRFGDYLS